MEKIDTGTDVLQIDVKFLLMLNCILWVKWIVCIINNLLCESVELKSNFIFYISTLNYDFIVSNSKIWNFRNFMERDTQYT